MSSLTAELKLKKYAEDFYGTFLHNILCYFGIDMAY
jgi:hypothetical protein